MWLASIALALPALLATYVSAHGFVSQVDIDGTSFLNHDNTPIPRISIILGDKRRNEGHCLDSDLAGWFHSRSKARGFKFSELQSHITILCSVSLRNKIM